MDVKCFECLEKDTRYVQSIIIAIESSHLHEWTRRPTPELVLFPADGIDGEGVRVLVAGRDDGAGQWQHPAGLLGPRLLVDKVLQQALLIVQDKKPGSNNRGRQQASTSTHSPSQTITALLEWD